jgi:general secretion pathway protein G
LTVVRRRHIETWGGFALGLLVAPLLMLMIGSAVSLLSEGRDVTGQYGIAIAGTRDLTAAVDRYRARYQHVPNAKDGLSALVPEFAESVPVDPWGNPYVYEPTGPQWADVLSYGADGRFGGKGGDTDISGRYGRLGSRPPDFLRPFATLVLAGLPIAAAIAASKRRWCASALAGMSAFWGVILLATLSPTMRSVVPWLSFTASLACLVGAIALLRALPYAALVSLLSIVVAHLLLQYVVTS